MVQWSGERVDEMTEAALAEVEEPAAHDRAGVQLGYVRETLTALLRKIGKKSSQTPLQELDLRLRRSDREEPRPRPVPCRSQPPRIGVFPLAANPIHWGHIIASLAIVDALDLDAMVMLPAGTLGTGVCAGRNAGEQDRHRMVQTTIDLFHPFLQYTDVAQGTNSPGEHIVHSIRALNSEIEMDLNLIYGVTNESQMREIMRRTLDYLTDRALITRNSRHHLDLMFIDGIGGRTVSFDPERLWRYRGEIGLQLRCRLVTINLPELAPFRSSIYRQRREAAVVPRTVHRYVLDHHLYG
jgi:nicotinic acid mononucleotide adenylyltransferase